MKKISKSITEKQLHLIWQHQDFTSELILNNGEKIGVIHPGEYNNDTGGPDFKHARIQIGNLTFVGDVEIDSDYSDWKNHGHNINKHYSKLILHVCYSNKHNQEYVYTVDGRKVNSICINNLIAADSLKAEVKYGDRKARSNKYNFKCNADIGIVDIETRRKYVLELGIERFQNKCQRVFHRLKELKFISELQLKEPVIGYELSREFNQRSFSNKDFANKYLWQQLLYEMTFEALGYSKNKLIMKKLAENVNIKVFEKIKNTDYLALTTEAVLFHVAGLLPENSEDESAVDYIKKLQNVWNAISNIYDGEILDETQWHFLGQRPQNFPTIRIFGGAKLLDSIITKNLVGTIIKKFTDINSTKVLINSIRSLFIIKASGYWKEHYVFNKKSKIKLNYVIGLSRADEIFINVLLPFLSVYFDMFGNRDLSKKVLKVYNEFTQKMDNKIVREVSNNLMLERLSKKTIYSQGMIELYRSYCTKSKCLECKLGARIFN